MQLSVLSLSYELEELDIAMLSEHINPAPQQRAEMLIGGFQQVILPLALCPDPCTLIRIYDPVIII